MFNFFISKLLQEGNQCVEKILSNYWIQLGTFRKYDSGFLNQSDCFLRKTTIRNKQTRPVKAHTDWSKKTLRKFGFLVSKLTIGSGEQGWDLYLNQISFVIFRWGHWMHDMQMQLISTRTTFSKLSTINQ